jgi:replicative DNA helicase
MTTPIITASPNNEMIVLGAILSSPENTKIGLKLVNEEDFEDRKHRIILNTIRNVYLQKRVIDTSLLINGLKSEDNLDYVGGPDYLISLAQCVGPSVYIEAEIEYLKTFTKKRELAALLISMKSDLEKGVDESKIIEKAKEKLGNIERKALIEKAYEIKPYTLEDLQIELSKTKEGLKTGYTKLDEMVRIPNEAITLVAGRPSHGKTTFMLNLFLNLIEQYPDLHFYFFSYEETRQQIAIKIINILSGCLLHDYQNLIQLEGYLKAGSDRHAMIEVGKRKYQELVESGRLRIVGDSFYIQDLLPIISSLKSKIPLGAIFIDYIQKIKNKEKFGTRQLELANTSNLILETAKGCSLPIILGAQLGRDKESKEKVKLDNLREAGDLEQDANLVLGLFNPSMQKALDEQDQILDRNVELKVTPLKNRGGIVNKTILLDFDRPLLKIKDMR